MTGVFFRRGKDTRGMTQRRGYVRKVRKQPNANQGERS